MSMTETELQRLVDEQAALRRVATLVAEGAPSEQLLAVVAEQLAQVFDVTSVSIARYEPDDMLTVRAAYGPPEVAPAAGSRFPIQGPTVVARARDTGRPARMDDYSGLPGPIAELCRRTGVTSAVGVPIAVAGQRLWGAILISSSTPGPLPDDTEERLQRFAQLIATAIANSEARDELEQLADEQAALRRIATLVAQEAPEGDVLALIGQECTRLFGGDEMRIVRYDDGPSQVVVASSGRSAEAFPLGSRHRLGGHNTSTMVFETGRPARIDSYLATATGDIAESFRPAGLQCAVATPIFVEGRLWGAMGLGSRSGPMPPSTEARLGAFTELMATAIANTESRAQGQRLADEQAALRHVATLVAAGASQAELFDAVVQQAAELLGGAFTALLRYDDEDGNGTIVAVCGAPPAYHPGLRVGGDDDGGPSRVFRTRATVRIDDYPSAAGADPERARESGLRSAVATPIVVEGRMWGMLGVLDAAGPLPPDTERRLEAFAELVATAIANTESRGRADRLAREQAALRRVATMIAREAPAEDVFATVAEEVARLFAVEGSLLVRYEPEGEVTVIGRFGRSLQLGRRYRLGGRNLASRLQDTQASARFDDYAQASGEIAQGLQDVGIRAVAAAPVMVDGRVWGLLGIGTSRSDPLPPDAETRIHQFTDLVGTAIANLQGRADLVASRARVVAASDETRRRIERDLHDGAQQRLVSTVLKLRLAREAADSDPDAVPGLLDEAIGNAEQAMDELGELVHGILPPVLAQGGLGSALRSLGRRMPLPVTVDSDVDHVAPDIAATAYFVVAEALTNVIKHAQATAAKVTVRAGASLRLEVSDDGVGGARADGGGLVGLADRLAVFAGHLQLESPPGGGTTLVADIPVGRRATDG
jgi:GAF domain-containing protein